MCDEQTVGVLVFAGNLILRQHVSQLLDKSDHFLVPGDISHGQAAGRAFPTVRHSLQTFQHTIRKKLRNKKAFKVINSWETATVQVEDENP